jgi:hypothetical protein
MELTQIIIRLINISERMLGDANSECNCGQCREARAIAGELQQLLIKAREHNPPKSDAPRLS